MLLPWFRVPAGTGGRNDPAAANPQNACQGMLQAESYMLTMAVSALLVQMRSIAWSRSVSHGSKSPAVQRARAWPESARTARCHARMGL